ncbi:ABC transporter transmembrane domain-containing protein [Mesorhizobium atlanticum]
MPAGLARIDEAVAAIEADLAVRDKVSRGMGWSSKFRLSLLRDITGFGAMVAHVGGWRMATALTFLILGSLTEGISILLLVPLLRLIGKADQDYAVRVPEALQGLVPGGTLSLATVLCLLVALVALQAIFNRFKSVYMARLLYDFVNRVRMNLFESIGRARWGVFTRIRSSDLDHALNGDVDRVQVAAFSLLMLTQATLLLTGYLVVSLFISPVMTSFAILIGLVLLVALQPFRARASAYGRTLTGNRMGPISHSLRVPRRHQGRQEPQCGGELFRRTRRDAGQDEGRQHRLRPQLFAGHRPVPDGQRDRAQPVHLYCAGPFPPVACRDRCAAPGLHAGRAALHGYAASNPAGADQPAGLRFDASPSGPLRRRARADPKHGRARRETVARDRPQHPRCFLCL